MSLIRDVTLAYNIWNLPQS